MFVKRENNAPLALSTHDIPKFFLDSGFNTVKELFSVDDTVKLIRKYEKNDLPEDEIAIQELVKKYCDDVCAQVKASTFTRYTFFATIFVCVNCSLPRPN